MRGIVVQAGDVGKRLSARVFETFADFLVDLFQCLNAIGGKRWRTNGNARFARLGQPRHFLDRVRFQPLFRAKA